MMRSCEFYLNKINKQRLVTCDFHCPVTETSAHIKNQHGVNDIIVLHTFIDFDVLFQSNESDEFDESQFNYMSCAYYDEDMNKCEGNFTETLNYFTKQKKIVLVYTDFYNYLVDEEYREKKEGLIQHACHGTLSIYYPYQKQYNLYHFNSHGCATKSSAWQYTKYITRRRTRTCRLDMPVDYYVLTKFVKCINQHVTSNHTYYNYKNTSEFNYMGPNLQQGDKNGICFVFPFLICCNILKNYNKHSGSSRTRSFQTWMAQGNIDKIIYTIMDPYVYDLDFAMYDNSDKCIDKITTNIGEQGGNMSRRLLHDFMNLLSKSNSD